MFLIDLDTPFLYSRKVCFSRNIWCVLGDFNSVSALSERRGIGGPGSLSSSVECIGFSLFIARMGLIELHILGRKFTWFHPNGEAVSRLDRILVSNGWWQFWGPTAQWALPRDVLDHFHILIKYDSKIWAPKPFRFNNHWLSHPEFFEVVIYSWSPPPY